MFRLLRSLRPLRVINRAPGLKLVVQTLLSSLRPIGNIVLICCTFFVIFGILGVQLFKGAFYYCEGPDIKNVRNKTDCLADKRNVWLNRKYNFDDLGKALMSLFVLSSRDGWVNIMYTGLDAVGVDQQVRKIHRFKMSVFSPGVSNTFSHSVIRISATYSIPLNIVFDKIESISNAAFVHVIKVI